MNTKALLMRRRDVRSELGISERVLDKLVEAQVLVPRRLPTGGRSYFLRAEVVRLVETIRTGGYNGTD